MRRRVRVVTGATALTVLVLSACTVPTPFGMRLNSDETVDYVLCEPADAVVEVDYGTDSESLDAESRPEWRATGAASYRGVVRYGEEPSGFERDRLEPPPEGWDWVDIGHGAWGAARDDLVEGEWVWFATSDYPWEPEHPCDGIAADDLEE